MKKSLASFILGLLSVAAFFAVPRWEGFMVSASHSVVLAILIAAIVLSLFGGIAAFFLGRAALKEVSDGLEDNRPARLARIGRASGIVGFILGLMGIWGSVGYLNAEVRVRIHHDQESLRQIGSAVEQYTLDRNCAPPDMLTLIRYGHRTQALAKSQPGGLLLTPAPSPFLKEVPNSAFAHNPPIRLLTLGHGRGSHVCYIILTPGPDGLFNMAPGPILKSQMEQALKGKAVTPWIIDQVYDPTNGIYSKGDIVALGGDGPVLGLVPR